MGFQYNFEKLEVWQKSKQLTVKIYKLTEEFPSSEKYGLTSQMRRAAVSIISNLAEGSSRTSLKDQANFYQIAFSSLTELLSQIIVAVDLRFMEESSYKELRNNFEEISNKINSLRVQALNRSK